MRSAFSVPFIDREKEMRSGLGIIYGRRRVGKTRLLLEWLKKRRGLFWEAFVGSYEELSKSFAETVRKEVGIYVPHDIIEALRALNDFDIPWCSTSSSIWSIPTPQSPTS